MPDLDLPAIEALLARATPSPWTTQAAGNQYIGTRYMPTNKCVATSCIPQLKRPWNPHAMAAFLTLDNAEEVRFTEPDAALIAQAPTLLRALVGRVKELEAALDEIRECMGGDHLDGWESPEDVWKIATKALGESHKAKLNSSPEAG